MNELKLEQKLPDPHLIIGLSEDEKNRYSASP